MVTKSGEAMPPQALLRKFMSQIRFRNFREWAATGVVTVAFVAIADGKRDWFRRACAIEVSCAALYIAWRLYRDGRVVVSPAELGNAESSSHALTREMRRQAALLERAARWYVAPLAVGWMGLTLADGFQYGFTPQRSAYTAVGAALGLLIVYANRLAARKLLARASSLDAGTSG